MGSLLRLLVLYWVIGQGRSEYQPQWFQNITTSLFKSPGDILLGGLFPINELSSNWSIREDPNDVHCDRINPNGLAQSLVMKFTLDEINAITELLPDIKLGFESFNTCKQSSIIVRPSLYFLTEGSSQEVGLTCNYTDYATRVVAVIGPSTSEMVTIVSKLFGFFLMPLISYGATSDRFSDKQQYPSFMRTVPSDYWQAMAMVQLLKEFSWNWVAVVGSEDEYGKQGQRLFSMLAIAQNVCVAYEALIPIYTNPKEQVKVILNHIQDIKVNVVVVFSIPDSAQVFFKEVIRRNMTGVWVASSSWALSRQVFRLPKIDKVGTILAFCDRTEKVDLLNSYARELFTKLGQERESGSFSRESDYNSSVINTCPDCWNLSLENMSMITDPQLQRQAYSVYLAVYSVAHALHRLLGCNTTHCSNWGKGKIYAWQLLEVLKKNSFNIKGMNFSFDSNGNPSLGYNLMVWSWINGSLSFKNIGTYQRSLQINSSLIKWHTNQSEVPKSTCSETCLSGQVYRVKGFFSCCTDCIDCREGTFQNNTYDLQCTPCPPGLWSTLASTNCTPPVFYTLSLDQYGPLGLILLAVTTIGCQGAVGLLFFRNRGSPMVRSAGGLMSGVALLSLAGGCISLVLFIVEPGDLVCRLQQPLNAFLPTVALSILLAITLQIVCVTEFPEQAPSHLETLRGSGTWLVVLACSGVQAGLCGWFLLESTPLTTYVSNMEVNFLMKFLRCPMQPMLGIGMMFAFNGLLSLICFMCTFLARKPSKQYNMARDITFATLVYCVAWVIFIPIFTSFDEKNKSISQMLTILATNIGILVSYYFPKCYLLLKQPDLNTADYFKIYLEGPPSTPHEDENH